MIPVGKAARGRSVMPTACDALVFFGATGDLAYKKIFPALQNMIVHDVLNVPVIGVAKAGWTIDQLRERARASLNEYGGGVNQADFSRLVERMLPRTSADGTTRRRPNRPLQISLMSSEKESEHANSF